MRKIIECAGRTLMNILLVIAVMVVVVVLMPLWIAAEIFDEE